MMLDRAAPLAALVDQPTRRRRNQRRYRRRQSASAFTVQIEVTPAIITWLVRAQWLRPAEFHTRAEVAAALAALLADSARA
jgi:hypothetical protein